MLSSFVLAFKSDYYFNAFFVVQFIFVFLTTFSNSTWFLDYGKTYVPGTSRLKKDIGGQLAFYLSYIMTPVAFLYTYTKLNGDLWAQPCVLFLTQMFYRMIVYPFFRRIKYQKVCPLESVIFRFFVSTCFGFSIGRLLAVHPRSLSVMSHLVWLCLYIPVTVALYVHDFWICRSRCEGPDGYVIMHKGLFKKFTCAQYTLQGLQWLLFSAYIDSFLSVWSYLIWLFITLSDRAGICHEYFIQVWPRYTLLNKYPMVPIRITAAAPEKSK